MHDDLVRVVVSPNNVLTAIGLAVVWGATGAWLVVAPPVPIVFVAYCASVPFVFVAAVLSAVTRWVVHASPDGVDLATEPIPLPLTGWSYPRSAVAFVSIDERENTDDDEGPWSSRRRSTTWAVVLTTRAGWNVDVTSGLQSGDQAKDIADRIRQAMRL